MYVKYLFHTVFDSSYSDTFFVLSVSVLFSYNSEMHVVLICSKRIMWRMLVRIYLDVLCYFMENYICGVETWCAIPWKLFIR